MALRRRLLSVWDCGTLAANTAPVVCSDTDRMQAWPCEPWSREVLAVAEIITSVTTRDGHKEN